MRCAQEKQFFEANDPKKNIQKLTNRYFVVDIFLFLLANSLGAG